LLEALRRGEADAAERLVATFGERAYRLAIGITGNWPDAEEAVRDAFWSVVRNVATFRGDAALGTWIYRITANATHKKRRRGARRLDKISLDEILASCHDNGS
jgi:RNA polymerase sigma-70 factor (ECF subfamily)